MNRFYITSPNLRSIGYDFDTHILEVAFLHGDVHHYTNVPFQQYQEFISSPHKETYLAKYIDNRYQRTR